MLVIMLNTYLYPYLDFNTQKVKLVQDTEQRTKCPIIFSSDMKVQEVNRCMRSSNPTNLVSL